MESIRLSFGVSYDLLQVIIMGGTPTKEIKCFILEIATFNWVCWQTANTSMVAFHLGLHCFFLNFS